MTIGLLFYFTKPDPLRPIEEKYVTDINGERNSFVKEQDAMLYLFDKGIRKFHRLTKELTEYKDSSKLPSYEFWHIDNRVGYVLYEYELYMEGDEVSFSLNFQPSADVQPDRIFKNAKIIDLLPNGLTPIESSNYTIIENYRNSGKTAVIYELGDLQGNRDRKSVV